MFHVINKKILWNKQFRKMFKQDVLMYKKLLANKQFCTQYHSLFTELSYTDCLKLQVFWSAS